MYCAIKAMKQDMYSYRGSEIVAVQHRVAHQLQDTMVGADRPDMLYTATEGSCNSMRNLDVDDIEVDLVEGTLLLLPGASESRWKTLIQMVVEARRTMDDTYIVTVVPDSD